jgi:protein-S-isoprenylcysteine O-methyltransferase Ste14
MTNRSDNPGVRIPPPLLYAAAVVGGWWLDSHWPLPIGGGPWRAVVAWVLVVAWAVSAASSIGLFWRQHTSMLPFRPATALVITGPYKVTRNPMYVALALLVGAFALFLNTWWPVMLLFPTLLAVQHFVIVPEERYLRRRFGAEYDAYARRVRRWF